MSEWIGLFGALAGAAIGGYGTYRISSLQHLHERKRDYHQRFLAACESLHELLSAEAGLANQMSLLIIGDLGYGAPFDASKITEKSQLSRIKMLVGFYVPELKEDIETISLKQAVVVRAVAEVIFQKSRTEEWKGNTAGDAAIGAAELTKLVTNAQEKLAAAANRRIESMSSG